MTSCHGYFEFFDYDKFKVRRCKDREVRDKTYPRETLMGVLVDNFPEFAQLVIKSKFDEKFADPQGKFTVFVPDLWSQFSAVELENMDVGKAKQVVASNTIVGRIRMMDLMTSQSSQLTAVDNMSYIHIWLDIRNNKWMSGNGHVGEQMDAYNGIIFPVYYNQPPEANILVSPEY